MVDWTQLPVALSPRRPGPRVDRNQAFALLESERTIAAALAVRAIAEAWDTGRLGVAATGLPHEREVVGLLGVKQGLAIERVKEASEALDDVMATSRALERSITARRPLDELIEEFALRPLARMIVTLVAAPQLWGEVAQLYAILANGAGRAVVDEHMLRALLGPRINPHELAFELEPHQPLRRFGLVHVADAPRPFAGLAVDPIVLARLRAEPLDEDRHGEIDVCSTTRGLHELRLPRAAVTALHAAVVTTPARPVRIVVRGRAGSGRRTLLAALAQLADRKLAVIHTSNLGDAPSAGGLARALQRCALAGWIPCLDGLDTLAADDRTLKDKLRRVIAEFPGPLTVRLERDGHAPIEPGYLQVDLPDLSETERVEVWRRELADAEITGEDGSLPAIAGRWRIGPGTIHRVVTQVRETGDVSARAIDRTVSQHLEARLGEVAERIVHLPALSDMVLPADILDNITDFLARLRYHRRVYEEWGMSKVASTGRGLTALFQGPPGTGKTMVAGAIARELGIELYRVDLSKIMSKWIGETERNLANVFSAAEEGQAIILFDEADSLFSKRTEVKSSNDRFANLEVNYLLQRLDSFIGIAILTTNLGTAIDSAFKRRLAFRVHFPIPDEEQREQLWRSHLPSSLPVASDLDLADLARKYPLTGGSVRNCVMRAAFLAAGENTKLSHEHLVRAVRLEYRAYGKLSESGPLE